MANCGKAAGQINLLLLLPPSLLLLLPPPLHPSVRLKLLLCSADAEWSTCLPPLTTTPSKLKTMPKAS